MQTLSQPCPKTVHILDEVGKPANHGLRQKAVCIIGGESEALGFHQETTEDSRKRQDWFCINFTLFCTRLAPFWLYGSKKCN